MTARKNCSISETSTVANCWYKSFQALVKRKERWSRFSIWRKTKTLLFGECRLGKTAPRLVLDTGTAHRPTLSSPSLLHFTEIFQNGLRRASVVCYPSEQCSVHCRSAHTPRRPSRRTIHLLHQRRMALECTYLHCILNLLPGFESQ